MDKHRSVLLVDDDEIVRGSLDHVIERAGHTCFVAENAIEALQMLRQHPVHAVIADHDMPGMNGIELLKLVYTRYPAVSRILLTGRTDAEIAKLAVNEGRAYRFLNKPCRSAELLTTLHFAFDAFDQETEKRRLVAQLRAQTAILDEIRKRFPGVLEEIENRIGAAAV